MNNFCIIHIQKIHQFGFGIQAGENKSNGMDGCWAHEIRGIDTPNADPKQFARNAIICVETEWKVARLNDETLERTACQSPTFLSEKVHRLFAGHQVIPKKDQVLLVAILMSISPEFFRNGTKSGKIDETLVEKWESAAIKFLRKKYGEQLVAVMIHLDESTPHLVAYLAPLVYKPVIPSGSRKKILKNIAKEATTKWVLSCDHCFTPDPYIKIRTKEGKIKKVKTGEKGTCSLLHDEYAASM